MNIDDGAAEKSRDGEASVVLVIAPAAIQPVLLTRFFVIFTSLGI